MHHSSSAAELAETLRHEFSGLAPGSRLPSNRQLVQRHHASASTVSAAIAELVATGAVETRPGTGSFTARTPALPPPRRDTSWQEASLALSASLGPGLGATRRFHAPGLTGTLATFAPGVIDLNSGYLHPDLQPLATLKSALARTAKNPEAWARPPLDGLGPLRSWFAREIGGDLSQEDVLVCAGGQAALATILRALTQPGDPIVVEQPTYPGITAAAHVAGLRTIGVPLDGEGLQSDALDEALERTRARVVVVQPLAQNPTGVTTSTERRTRLLEITRDHGTFVIEDDYAHYLAHADAPPAPEPMVRSDPDGVVIHIRSLTKATSPNVRIAAVAARGPVIERLRHAFAIETMLVPAALQLTALETLTSRAWPKEQRILGEALAHRRTLAAHAVTVLLGVDSLTTAPRHGYHLWLRLPATTNAATFTQGALSLGVALTPGTNYTSDEGGARFVRLSYVAAPSAQDVTAGIEKLRPLLATNS